jgi:kumamolisin
VNRSKWIAAVAVVVLGFLVIPGITTAIPVGVPIVSLPTPAAPVPSFSLPPALLSSWADRSGFVPAASAESGPSVIAQNPITVSVTLWPTNLSLFAPRPVGGGPLTTAEFAQKYSPSPAEYQSVLEYFERYGLSVLHTWPDRLSVTLDGPSPRFGAAFDTTLVRGSVAGHPVLYPETVPRLPSTLQSEISGVSGLSAGFTQFTLPVTPVSSSLLSPSQLTTDLGSTTSEVTPSGAHGAYGLDALYNSSGVFHSAASQNIVLLLWGDGYAPSDLSTFFASYYPSEYPATPTVRAFPIDGAPMPSENAVNDPSGGPQELTLDIEWAGSMAPGATLDAVYAPDGPAPTYSPNDTPMEDALKTAVNSISGVSVISMSFGLPESQDTPFQTAYNTLFAEAETKGITVVAASGDDGGSTLSHGACTASPEVEFPASAPDVLAVGGTEPTLNVSLTGQITGIATQPAWNRSGGGLSNVYTAPSWQLVGSAATVIGNGGRGVPDVAGPAADNMLYYHGSVGQLAGTSFATPFWAGIIGEMDAVRGAPLGFVTPRLYALASLEAPGDPARAFSDVTAGGNCLYPARAGWDLATGWGTPRPLDLYAALTSTFVDLSVKPSPDSVFPGGSTIVTVTVLNASNGQPVSGAKVNLSFSASPGYTGPCGGSFGSPVTVVTGVAGTAQAHFSVPFCYFGGQAQVSALLLSNGLFGQATATVTVSLLSGSGFLSLIATFPYNAIFFGLIVVIAILVGVALSRRSKRRRPIPPLPPLGAAGSSGGPPSWVGAPSAGGPPGPPRAPNSTMAYAATAPPTAPVQRIPTAPTSAPPPASMAPPATAAGTPPGRNAGSPPPMPTPVRCPACGSPIPAFSLSCPKCGLARP